MRARAHLGGGQGMEAGLEAEEQNEVWLEGRPASLLGAKGEC